MSDTLKTVLIDGGFPVALSDSNEDNRFIYNLLPVGKFYDKRYGTVDVTKEKLIKMAENFGKFPSYEVPIKLGHSDGAKSPGKVIAVEAKDTGLEITMLVDKETAQAINDKQYRYMSAEFDENYYDKTTGYPVGEVLLGAALVNQPANPYMQPLKLVDDINPEGGINMNEVEELKKKLSEAQAEAALNAKKLSDTENQLKTATEKAEADAKKLADIEAANKVLLEERERAENAKNEAEVKAFSDKWTAAGIPPAVIEKVKPVLLGKTSRVIKLSDDEKDDTPTLKFFDDLFAGLPKMPMKQIGGSSTSSVELSDVQKAVEHGKAIADSLK